MFIFHLSRRELRGIRLKKHHTDFSIIVIVKLKNITILLLNKLRSIILWLSILSFQFSNFNLTTVVLNLRNYKELHRPDTLFYFM